MKFMLVDTSVWSLILRRKNPKVSNKREAAAIDMLVYGLLREKVVTSPTVVTELTTGTSDAVREQIQSALSRFPSLPITPQIMQRATAIQRTCRSKGVQIGYRDCEIIATAEAAGCLILALDRDFEHAQRILGSELVVVLQS
jgi:predicted nucleic acid-binding protein